MLYFVCKVRFISIVSHIEGQDMKKMRLRYLIVAVLPLNGLTISQPAKGQVNLRAAGRFGYFPNA